MCFSCVDTEKLILKFICKSKETRKAKTIKKKKKIKVGGIALPNIKTNCIACYIEYSVLLEGYTDKSMKPNKKYR